MCNTFLEYRTRNRPIKINNSSEKKVSYFYKEGNFPWDYCGKYCGPWNNNRNTEILSQGLEMLFEDPIKYYGKDREYLSFILGIIHFGDIIEI